MQKELVTHDTENRSAGVFGTGTGTLLHEDPFQISDGSTEAGGVVVSLGPTAMQNVASTQETDGRTKVGNV